MYAFRLGCLIGPTEGRNGDEFWELFTAASGADYLIAHVYVVL